MTGVRDELHHLVDDLPNDQVEAALTLVRQLTRAEAEEEWPPSWFGMVTSDRQDTAARAKEILGREYGRRRTA